MAVKDSQIRQVIIEFLKRPDSNSKRSITFRHIRNEGVLDLCREKIPGFDKGDEERVYELFYELSLERIIVPDENTGPYQWPFYRLTTHGRRVLAHPADCTYDPDGYVEQLKRRVPHVNDTVVFYVHQAVTCFSHRLLPAASVMLGCAAEKLILDLVYAFVSAP